MTTEKMSRVTCGAIDCKHNGNKCKCLLNKVTLYEAYDYTANEGLQHFWRCKQYEKSDEVKALEEQFHRLMKGE